MTDVHVIDLKSLDLNKVVLAVGALGTAAFGLVDATKAFGGGINKAGFRKIRAMIGQLVPGPDREDGFGPRQVLATLEANWFNGTDIAAQKAIAKSLVKLNLNKDNAETLANTTGIDPAKFKSVAEKIALGTTMTEEDANINARFDMVVTAMLDGVYERGVQTYKNSAKVLAMVFSMLLALGGSCILGQADLPLALLVGFFATPLAPIAKDLSTALGTAVTALKSVRKQD